MQTQVIRSLEELQNALNTIPSINSGGCGISALAMYLWLRKHKNKRPKIVFCYKSHSQDTYENNDVALKNHDLDSLSVPNHIVLSSFLKKFDSEGKLDSRENKSYKWFHTVNLHTLIKVINNQDGWNPSFDRKYVSTIESWLEMKLPITSNLPE